MARKHIVTREEKVAQTIIDLVCDLRLNLDMIGLYLAQISRKTEFSRLEVVLESAQENKETFTSREAHYESIKHISN